MKFFELYDILNSFAPFKLSDEFMRLENEYDNSGAILETNRDINSVVFSLDLTNDCVDYAKSIDAQVIITHHPAIFTPIKKLCGALKTAANADIGVISTHLNLDCANLGIDYNFAVGLGAKSFDIIQKLSSGGYGRIFESDKTLKQFAIDAEKEFQTKVRVYGDENLVVKKVACFCGAGLDLKYINDNADLFVSCDIRHHVLLAALENKKCVIDFTHYSCENYGLQKVCESLSKSQLCKIKVNYFNDRRFI